MIVEVPGQSVDSWPNVHTLDNQLYFKPDAGRLLVSPADETPSPPVDAQPEEYDVALGAARLEEWTQIEVERVLRKWAGLRSFVADGVPVLGAEHERECPNFFWAAALGGYGVQTSPAVGMLIADLIQRGGPRAGLALDPRHYTPTRFARHC